MRARIVDQRAIVYSEPDAASAPVTQANPNEEVELGGIKKRDGKGWVAVRLASGQTGYLEGSVKIFHIKPVTLLDRQAEVHSEPSSSSPVKTRFRRNARFLLVDNVSTDGKGWVKVRDNAGIEGFVDGGTRIKRIAEITKSVGQKNMLYGALWCVGGIAVTAGTYAIASSGGGTYFIAWGAVLFGGIKFFKGLYQFITAPL
jgi:hypothetical protein